MDLILDTNALSAIAEGEPDAAKQFYRARRVAIPVIVLVEYRFGIAQSRHQQTRALAGRDGFCLRRARDQ